MRERIEGDIRLERCFAIAFTQLRFIRCSLKETLKGRQLWDDLRQEVMTAAIEAYRVGFNPDTEFKEIKNLVQRRIYRFLRNYGFARYWNRKTSRLGKGFTFRELSFSELDESRSSVIFSDNAELILWLRGIVTTEFGQATWEEVIDWAKSSKAPSSSLTRVLEFMRERMLATTEGVM